ncbi:MAG TPA: ATP-grasp domain-containing protein [Chitinophagales bacterium]|nr:ATP-grasp domain-containing protein [Chitinophagales bacterium]
MSKRLLISGLGGSLFPYLHGQLIKEGYQPYYVDSNTELKYVYPDLDFTAAPLTTSAGYKQFISDICIENKIDVYIPLIDEEIITALEIEETLPGLVVIVPDKKFSALCLDKYKLMKALKDKGISINPTYMGHEFSWQFAFPVFVKPNIGRGSRGIRKIESSEQLAAYYTLENYKPEEVIIQPYIEGTEYTVAVVANRKNKLVSISPKRIIQKKGITISAITETNSLIEDVTNKIIDQLQPCGPFNMQLFVTKNNEPVVFEINPRFSTTTVLSYEAGLKEITLYINQLHNENPTIQRAADGVYIYRRWENVFYSKQAQ